MTKQEQELVWAFTELEKAIARLDYYEDQTDHVDDINTTLSEFKSKFYSILLEKDEE
jgi:hypothetical protein